MQLSLFYEVYTSLIGTVKLFNIMLTVFKPFPFLFSGGNDGSGSICHLPTIGLEVCKVLREAP